MSYSQVAGNQLLVPPRDAAKMLAISEKNLWTLTKQGVIPAIRVGVRSVRYSVVALQEWIAAQK